MYRTAAKFQQIVMEVAAKHGVDLEQSSAYLRLVLLGHGQLVVERIGGHRISVTRYVQVNQDWTADPQIVVYVNDYPEDGEVASTWSPIESIEFFGGWRLFGEPDALGQLVVYDPQSQVALTDWVEETFTPYLRKQGWLEHAVRASLPIQAWEPDELWERDIRVDEDVTAESMAAYLSDDEDGPLPVLAMLSAVGTGDWPEPTTDVPDMDTLGEWTWDYGMCEATDGCPVEPDGTCEHGHPSWLLRLGLI